MPLYTFRCPSGHSFQKSFEHNYEPGWTRNPQFKTFETQQFCPCGASARRVISVPMFSVDNTDYACPITGTHIGSKHQHEENLKQQDCRVLEAGEREQNILRRKREDRELDRKIENTVEKTIESWSSDKRDQLAKELVNQGLDIVVERK